ncbi:MAG: hypothetical protein ABIS47_00750 [Acidimicrobiales bacterium]
MAADQAETARTFVQAVAWGEHHVVWDMLGSEAQRVVMGIATNRGMPEPLAARLRDGTATTAELDQFRGDLVNGFRADLLGVDVDTLEYDVDPAPLEEGTSRVVLVVPVPDPVLGAGLPAASLELRQEDGAWRVERLIPRLAK